MRTVTTIALAAAALLCGCAQQKSVAVDSTVLRLRLTDYRIYPAALTMHAGRMKIVAFNAGRLAHDVRIEPGSAGPGVDGTNLGETSTARPGETVSSEKLMLAPGTYKLVDTIAKHADLGDYATLIVR